MHIGPNVVLIVISMTFIIYPITAAHIKLKMNVLTTGVSTRLVLHPEMMLVISFAVPHVNVMMAMFGFIILNMTSMKPITTVTSAKPVNVF